MLAKDLEVVVREPVEVLEELTLQYCGLERLSPVIRLTSDRVDGFPLVVQPQEHVPEFPDVVRQRDQQELVLNLQKRLDLRSLSLRVDVLESLHHRVREALHIKDMSIEKVDLSSTR